MLDAIRQAKEILRSSEALLRVGTTEYHLIQLLGKEGVFTNFVADNANLALYQKHFICMHVLYDLQQEYRNQQQWLTITPLRIQLVSGCDEQTPSRQLSEGYHHLRDYYLDLDNLFSATEHSVDNLLKKFWDMYSAQNTSAEAFSALGLDGGEPWSEIQRVYRQKVKASHPDRGGDAREFNRIREAYEQLRVFYRR